MTLNSLIEILKQMQPRHGNADVVVDFELYGDGEGHGYYDLEGVNTKKDEDGNIYVNLKSSSEM